MSSLEKKKYNYSMNHLKSLQNNTNNSISYRDNSNLEVTPSPNSYVNENGNYLL